MMDLSMKNLISFYSEFLFEEIKVFSISSFVAFKDTVK